MSVSEPRLVAAIPSRSAGIYAGALTAAGLCLIAYFVMMIVVTIRSPRHGFWMLTLFPLASPFIVALTLLCAAIGKLIDPFKNVFLATAAGLFCGAIFTVIYEFISFSPQPLSECLKLMGPVCAVCSTSAIVAMAANRSAAIIPRLNRRELLALAIPLLLVAAAYAVATHSAELDAKITRAGGFVTWNGWQEPKRRWIVSFSGTPFGDAELQQILPTLAHYSRLELDLGHTGVTDAGVGRLDELPGLVRLQIQHTAVTEQQVTLLRRRMPHVDIRQ